LSVRVRFAPSPTGELHVGGAHTALFNFLFARHTGGTFVLRIEDTDRKRLVPGATERIMEALRWLGLDWDEGPDKGGPYGPYIQSQRLELYHQVAQQLLEQGHAYYCYCSPERLEQLRQEQQRQRKPTGYDRRCRFLTPEQRAAFEAQGIRPVIRFAMLLEGETVFKDLLRKDPIVFQHSVLEDRIIIKSDGFPVYDFANVVDDHYMRITHVIRGEEFISSTPHHVRMYAALGWEMPVYAHLPLLLGPDRSKLSKRHGDTSLLEFRDRGYLPEAMVNYLALLGWSYGDQEFFTLEELIRYFELERVGTNAAIFNIEKLDWMNGAYIRRLSLDELLERSLPFYQRAGLVGPQPTAEERRYLRDILALLQERLKRLDEVGELSSFFFRDEPYDPKLLVSKGLDAARALAVLQAVHGRLARQERWEASALETELRALAAELGVKPGQIFGAGLLRVAVTGRTVGPPLFETMALLGRERCLKRIEHAIALLQQLQHVQVG
jgi:glutamyl-tRNA synthetase